MNSNMDDMIKRALEAAEEQDGSEQDEGREVEVTLDERVGPVEELPPTPPENGGLYVRLVALLRRLR